ncbi:hypothetical protein BDQ17DRAFT_1331134 [Cyathus striatus]|nr:hypothetical protein BDQ17DRAFT_1331134 [Cyathus striatus]
MDLQNPWMLLDSVVIFGLAVKNVALCINWYTNVTRPQKVSCGAAKCFVTERVIDFKYGRAESITYHFNSLKSLLSKIIAEIKPFGLCNIIGASLKSLGDQWKINAFTEVH